MIKGSMGTMNYPFLPFEAKASTMPKRLSRYVFDSLQNRLFRWLFRSFMTGSYPPTLLCTIVLLD